MSGNRFSAQMSAITAGVVIITALSLVFASQGVRDAASSAYGTVQPDVDELLLDLQVQVAYDDSDVVMRFEWQSSAPGIHHDFLVYEGGEWVRRGGKGDGSAFPLNEDRITFFLDDGSVDGFEHYGGFMTIYSFTRGMSAMNVSSDETEATIGQSDLRKMLPGSMEDVSDWRTLREEAELVALRESGYFLDLWHWRSHRSNPIGWSDDQYVIDRRRSDSGSGIDKTNFDGDLEQPLYMFDPAITGQYAMSWDKIQSLGYTMDDAYFLSADNWAPFDPDHAWQEGDALPRQYLVEPEGSRGSIFSQASMQDGRWTVELRRALDTGSPLDDKILREFGKYHLAPAVHTGGTAGRWHYIGMPVSLGLGRPADIEAVRFTGRAPDWNTIAPTTVTLFYPGVIGWDHISDSRTHSGADAIAENRSFSDAHSPEKMAFYALESEFRSEIITQWQWTTVIWLLFVLATAVAFVPLARRNGRERSGDDIIIDSEALHRAGEFRA